MDVNVENMPLPELEVDAAAGTPAVTAINSDVYIEPDFAKAECIGAGEGVMDGRTAADRKIAKKFCELCDIRKDCLEYALREKIGAGVWGGKDVKERRKILKERAFQNKNQLDVD